MILLEKILSIYWLVIFAFLFYNSYNDKTLSKGMKIFQFIIFHIPMIVFVAIIWLIEL